MNDHEPRVALLRHLVATIAYRATVAVRGFPAEASQTAPTEGARTPLELLAHVADLMQWSALLVRAEGRPRRATDASWAAAEARLYVGLADLDAALVAGIAPDADVDALLQGPLADALTHVGQLLLLRRLAGAPAEGQRYMRSSITAGVVGPEQPGLAGVQDAPY
jgi:hypothetical protein